MQTLQVEFTESSRVPRTPARRVHAVDARAAGLVLGVGHRAHVQPVSGAQVMLARLQADADDALGAAVLHGHGEQSLQDGSV